MHKRLHNTKPKSHKNKFWGTLAERWVAFWLIFKGYTLVAHQYLIKGAEVDLIMKKDDTLVFIEVKQRPTFMMAKCAVDGFKQKRMIQAARFFVSHAPNIDTMNVRFDIVAVNGFGVFEHTQNAFEGNVI